jgi:hypothetical protein
MTLTPLSHQARPTTAQFPAWKQAGLAPALAHVLDYLWLNRPVLWVGAPDPTVEAMARLWQGLAEVGDDASLLRWTAEARQCVWGTSEGWATLQEKAGVTEARSAWARGLFLLGGPALRWIADDSWRLQQARAEQAKIDYETLERRAARRHRERLACLPAHPEPEGGWSVRRVRQRAQALSERFGFRALRTAGGMPIQDVWSALLEAERGLTAMAQALGWKEIEIGHGRLGLTFELDVEGAPAGYFDPLTHTLNIGRLGGWGSFAHEWAHALDRAVGQVWRPGTTGEKAFASYRAEDPIARVPELWQAEQADWRDRDPVPLNRGQALVSLHAALKAFPRVLKALRDRLPHAEWEDRLERRLLALNVWITKVTTGQGTPEVWAEDWLRWKVGNNIAWSAPEGAASQRWQAQWNRTVAVAERVFWGQWPKQAMWRTWSAARDAVEGRTYWNTPQEAFARLVQAVLRDRIGADTWVADATVMPDVFPQGEELAHLQQWWKERDAALRSHWAAPLRDHPVWWAAMDAPIAWTSPTW